MTAALALPDTAVPSPEDARIAQESARTLAPFRESVAGPLQVKVICEGTAGERVTIPAPAFKLLRRMLELMAQGDTVTLIPIHAELTTQEAAALLNVSRPFVIKAVKNGELACHMVGTHRRISFRDLMAYKARMAKIQEAAMDALVAEAQELNLGY